VGVIVYAGSQGQFPLDGATLERLRGWCPAIVGTKTTGFDAVATTSLLVRHADLAHFVHEQVLTGWVGVGAAGAFSNLALLDPAFTVGWYRLMTAGRWTDAFGVQRRVLAFYEQGVVPVRQAGFTVDKALAELGGHPGMGRALRAPYGAVPDTLMAGMRRAADVLLADGVPGA
jgi:dihydrodipicolinate synthase/N-acetylneuraminate lyase